MECKEHLFFANFEEILRTFFKNYFFTFHLDQETSSFKKFVFIISLNESSRTAFADVVLGKLQSNTGRIVLLDISGKIIVHLKYEIRYLLILVIYFHFFQKILRVLPWIWFKKSLKILYYSVKSIFFSKFDKI